MAFNFGEVLTRAWQIAWKYKVLWIFGILAGCAQGNGGANTSWSWDRSDRNRIPTDMQHAFDQANQWLTSNWWVVILIALGVLLLTALFIFLGTIGRIGLIQGTLQAEAGAGSLSFGPLFSQSTPFFWRVFGLAFLVGL